MSDNASFDEFVAHVRRGNHFEISKVEVPGLVIKLWFGEVPLLMAVVSPGKARVAVKCRLEGLDQPTLCEVGGSGNEANFYSGRIALGLELLLLHLDGENIQFGKITRMTLRLDPDLHRRFTSSARSSKRWRDKAHIEQGIDETLKEFLPDEQRIAAEHFLLVCPLSINGKITAASLLVRSYDAGFFEEALALLYGTYCSIWAYQPPDVRGDMTATGLPMNRLIFNEIWGKINTLRDINSTRVDT